MRVFGCAVVDDGIDFGFWQFFMLFSFGLILEKIKKIYFLSRSLLNELLNINHFISKSILTNSVFGSAFIKLILDRINFEVK